MTHLVLDAHAHCGLTVPFQELWGEWQAGSINGGVIFAPVEEIYDRYDPRFTDSEEYRKSRRRAHRYILETAGRGHIYPFFFVWNDFPRISDEFVGIKWHRHANEPVYAYDTIECRDLMDEICERKLPVVFEEEFPNTLDFIRKIDERTVVIIPHMGGFNGGYARLKGIGVFENRKVWVDTALAEPSEIADFTETYGTDRILFGSDYPFGTPAREREKVERLFSGRELRDVLSGNLLRLVGSRETSAASPARDA